MAERNVNPPNEPNSQDLPEQLRQLQDAHAAHGSNLELAFTPDVRVILRRLSDEDTFFDPQFSRETSTDTSCTTDSTESISRPSTPIPPEETPNRWNSRNVFKFLHDEFMVVTESERMASFHRFYNSMKKTANDSEMFSAVTTVKDAIVSKFESVRILGRQMFGGAGSSFSGQGPTEGNVSNPYIPGGAHQNVSERSTVGTPIRPVQLSTPMHVAGNAAGFPGTGQQQLRSVIQTNPGYSGGARPSEPDREDRSRSRSGSPSTRGRYPFKRQDHVREED